MDRAYLRAHLESIVILAIVGQGPRAGLILAIVGLCPDSRLIRSMGHYGYRIHAYVPDRVSYIIVAGADLGHRKAKLARGEDLCSIRAYCDA